MSLAGLGIQGHSGASSRKRAGQVFGVGLLAQEFGLRPHQRGVGVARRLSLLTLAQDLGNQHAGAQTRSRLAHDAIA